MRKISAEECQESIHWFFFPRAVTVGGLPRKLEDSINIAKEHYLEKQIDILHVGNLEL